MKQTREKECYEPPRVEAVQVHIESGYSLSLAVGTEDWEDGGDGKIYTD